MDDRTDASDRAEALLALTDLDDPASRRLLLEAAADRTPLPARFRPQAEVDPFAAFFGGTEDVAQVTLSDLAVGRLEALPFPASGLDDLVTVLEADPPEALVAAIARLAGNVAWDDPIAALRALVPRLHAADAPLYELIVRQDDAGLAVFVESALSPYRSRAVNELLAHAPAHHKMAAALADAITTGRVQPSPSQAMAILGQLVAWNVPRAPEVATILEDRYPWAVAYAAFDDAPARARLRTFIESGAEIPDILPGRMDEVLKSRPPVPGWPLEAWLRRTDGDPRVIAVWGAVRECADLLRAWAAADDERGAASARLLVEVGLSDGLESRIPALVLDGGWDAAALERVASVPGVAGAIEGIVRQHPAEWRLIPAWLASGPPAGARRELAEILLSVAEAAPVTRRVLRRGGVHVQREGLDTTMLRGLVASCGDPDLDARLDAVLPYTGPA